MVNIAPATRSVHGFPTGRRNVSGGFRLALTGTPGTGKSTLAQALCDAGFEVVTVESLAEQHGLLGDVDSSDGARVIDTDALHDVLVTPWESPPVGPSVVDGHLSHHLPCDAVAVLRCSPDILEARLTDRGYPEGKAPGWCLERARGRFSLARVRHLGVQRRLGRRLARRVDSRWLQANQPRLVD